MIGHGGGLAQGRECPVSLGNSLAGAVFVLVVLAAQTRRMGVATIFLSGGL
jgi:hypothetical protein